MRPDQEKDILKQYTTTNLSTFQIARNLNLNYLEVRNFIDLERQKEAKPGDLEEIEDK